MNGSHTAQQVLSVITPASQKRPLEHSQKKQTYAEKTKTMAPQVPPFITHIGKQNIRQQRDPHQVKSSRRLSPDAESAPSVLCVKGDTIVYSVNRTRRVSVGRARREGTGNVT